jgi:hypothetical protein
LRDILSASIFDAKWVMVYCQLKSACPLFLSLFLFVSLIS